jgi:broad specificity phosphatase PhoE
MLILLRHGRTPANADGRLLGRADPSLDEVGIAHARAAAGHLGRVDRVVSSPLARCRETASWVAANSGVDVEIDERAIELNYGEWEGRPISDVSAAEWSTWRDDAGFRVPGGETLLELRRRVESLCNDLAADAAERDVVVVSHVSPCKAAVLWALGVDDAVSWRLFVPNCGIARIAVRNGLPQLVTFGETAAGWG